VRDSDNRGIKGLWDIRVICYLLAKGLCYVVVERKDYTVDFDIHFSCIKLFFSLD